MFVNRITQKIIDEFERNFVYGLCMAVHWFSIIVWDPFPL